MINITHKSNSLRKAIAGCTVKVSNADTIKAVEQFTVPKGNVLETARVAGLFAAKKTSEMIPDCHPLPVEFTEVRFQLNELSIDIQVEVHTIYKTGVEVEAMHSASVVALTIYDMLKPIDNDISIENLRLISKSGGKSSKKIKSNSPIRSWVIVCSDSIHKGEKEDRAGKAIIEKLTQLNLVAEQYKIIPDEIAEIQTMAKAAAKDHVDLLIFTGGTGLSPRDVTPEALLPIIERRIPGMEETIRNYGQERMPYSMLSRSVAGFIGKTLILALPGSTKGAAESMDAIFPAALHVFDVLKAFQHD